MEVRYSKEARKALLKSNKRDLLIQKIELLASDPDAIRNNVKQLTGRDEMRLRVQDWRILFLIQDGIILIREIGHRSSVYED
jgi:mRNA-degrading endonuclease RelE of RelBE toxin-antitoxin system